MSASAHTKNLGRAARLLKRIADPDGLSEFEGVPLCDIVADVLEAQNAAFMREAYERVGIGGAPPRVPDASPFPRPAIAGLPFDDDSVEGRAVARVLAESEADRVENVIPFPDTHSRRVGA